MAGKDTGKAGGTNGVPFGPNDILVRNTAGQWRKAFDFWQGGNRFLARKGHVIGLHWQHGRVENVEWGIARSVLGFPKPINSLSIGPEWGNSGPAQP